MSEPATEHEAREHSRRRRLDRMESISQRQREKPQAPFRVDRSESKAFTYAPASAKRSPATEPERTRDEYSPSAPAEPKRKPLERRDAAKVAEQLETRRAELGRKLEQMRRDREGTKREREQMAQQKRELAELQRLRERDPAGFIKKVTGSKSIRGLLEQVLEEDESPDKAALRQAKQRAESLRKRIDEIENDRQRSRLQRAERQVATFVNNSIGQYEHLEALGRDAVPAVLSEMERQHKRGDKVSIPEAMRAIDGRLGGTYERISSVKAKRAEARKSKPATAPKPEPKPKTAAERRRRAAERLRKR